MQTQRLFLTIVILLNIFVLKAQKVEVLGDAKINGTMEVMDTILFSDGTKLASACLDSLSDMDGDTYLTLEKNPDEDVIRLVANGVEVMVITEDNLRLDHNGSIFIGSATTGAKDIGNTRNIFLGISAGANNLDGNNNIFLGNNAGQANTSGSENIFIGTETGSEENSTSNIFIGHQSGFNNIGQDNVFIGNHSGESNPFDDNVFIGNAAGQTNRGSRNIFIGNEAGNQLTSSISHSLVIQNSSSASPLIYGNFLNEYLSFNGSVFINKFLEVHNEIEGEHCAKFISDNPAGPVAIFENESSDMSADGIIIKINRDKSGPQNNFITFENAAGIAGRIEGFRLDENNVFATFPTIDFSLYFDPINIRNLAFDRGTLPSLNGGSWPELVGGAWPTIKPGVWPTVNPGLWPTINKGAFPTLNKGELPSVTGGSFGSISLGADLDALAANLACQPIGCPGGYEEWLTGGITGASFPHFDEGSLPSLNPGVLPSLNPGTWPTLNPGTWPTLNPGSWPSIRGSFPTLDMGELPSFNIDVLINPVPRVSASINFKEVICWALTNGERSLITTNPWDMAMLQSSDYLSSIAECKDGGVTYGSGGADYAEYLLREDKDEIIQEGQIVGVKGGKISKNTEGAEQLLVISMMPIVLGNVPEDSISEALYEKVGFLGQAPVWVVGKVRSGDYIIPSGHHDGYGLAIAPEDLKLEHLSKIVGRAWGDGESSINLVNMVIGLKTNEMASILNRNQEKMNEMEDRLAQIEDLLGIHKAGETLAQK